MAIPKGSLEEATFALLGKAWTRVSRKNRTYRVFLDDSEIIRKNAAPARDTGGFVEIASFIWKEPFLRLGRAIRLFYTIAFPTSVI